MNTVGFLIGDFDLRFETLVETHVRFIFYFLMWNIQEAGNISSLSPCNLIGVCWLDERQIWMQACCWLWKTTVKGTKW